MESKETVIPAYIDDGDGFSASIACETTEVNKFCTGWRLAKLLGSLAKPLSRVNRLETLEELLDDSADCAALAADDTLPAGVLNRPVLWLLLVSWVLRVLEVELYKSE